MKVLKYYILIIAASLLVSLISCETDTEVKPQEIEEEKIKYKLLFFREDCFDQFLDLNFFYEDCISITISKGLGYGIIVGASLVKAPQIYNIVKARSGRGILPSMFYMECFMFIINGCYNIHLNSPFSVYGENFLLLLSNFVIIALLWIFGNKTSIAPKAIVTLSIFGTLTFLYFDSLVPGFLWNLFMDIQILMVAYSRMPQILENYKTKFTGELSSIMFLANACGNLARTYTFMKETQSLYNVFTSGLSTILNFAIFIQVMMYWQRSKSYKKAIEMKDVENQVSADAPSQSDETPAPQEISSNPSDGRPSL